MELFMKYPQELQNNLLMDLLRNAAVTEVGKRYQFHELNSYQKFAERLPLTDYETVHQNIDRCRRGEGNIFWPSQIKWFAMSSGTTAGRSKFIPVSPESLEDCHYAAAKDLLCMYLNNNPHSRLFVGKGLRLGGSKELNTQWGTSAGDLSSILIDNMPFWADYSSTPKNDVALMPDWETKLPAIIRESLKENVTSLAGVPSWMLVLLNRVLEVTGKENILQVWPAMEVFFHGGVNFAPYAEQYRRLLPSEDIKYYESYNASEGFFAIQDHDQSKDLLLMLDYGIFYEFIPMDTYGTSKQKTIPLDEVELGRNYAIVITTNAGLWRYQVGDTVRFTSLSPYRLRVTGRTKHHINVFGEELIIENAEEALKKASALVPCAVKEYTVAPIFMDGRDKGAHEWMVEFEEEPEDIIAFAKALDAELQNVNTDYEAKRYNDTTLNMLTLHKAKANLFYDWLKKQGKLGGQHKVPRLLNHRELMEELLEKNGS